MSMCYGFIFCQVFNLIIQLKVDVHFFMFDKQISVGYTNM